METILRTIKCPFLLLVHQTTALSQKYIGQAYGNPSSWVLLSVKCLALELSKNRVFSARLP